MYSNTYAHVGLFFISRRQTMLQRSLRYNAYLIRLWEEGTRGVWRASAQHVQSGVTVRFADAADLFAFLQTQMLDAPLLPLPIPDSDQSASQEIVEIQPAFMK